MTRRRQTSPAKDLVDIVALLPWWAGVVMAVLAYSLLHSIAPAAAQPHSSEAPAFPNCGKAMPRRTAKRGANAGASFWGCTGYPACRGTRQIG